MFRATRALVGLLVLGVGCVRSNRDLADELEAAARNTPRPDLDAVAAHGYGPLPPRPPLRTLRLPMLPGELPVVAGEINRQPMRILLDTGSSHVFLTGPAAHAAGLYVPPGRAVPVVAPGAATLHRNGVVESIGFGGAAFGPGVAAFPLTERRVPDLGREHAVAGASVLCHFRATFDFRRREVRLEPLPRPGRPSTLTIRALVQGRPLNLLVDSGAERLVLEPRIAADLGLISPAAARKLAKTGSAAGRTRRKSVQIRTVRVAGRTFRHVAGWVVATFPKMQGAPDGLLGLRGLGKLSWTLDYGTRRLTVEE